MSELNEMNEAEVEGDVEVVTEEATEAVPAAIPTLAEACQSLLEMFDISTAGADVVACALNLLDVAQEVTKLENIDFTSKAAIGRACTGARADTLDVIKKLTMIRKGGELPEVVGIDEETQEPIIESTLFGGFMALRDNAFGNVGEITRKLALANKQKEMDALKAEIKALEDEEAAE